MKWLLIMCLLVSWVCLERGYCNNGDKMGGIAVNNQDKERVKHYSSGVLMSIGDGFLVIDDHVLTKSPEFRSIEIPETGVHIWFWQNRSGEVMDIILIRGG